MYTITPRFSIITTFDPVYVLFQWALSERKLWIYGRFFLATSSDGNKPGTVSRRRVLGFRWLFSEFNRRFSEFHMRFFISWAISRLSQTGSQDTLGFFLNWLQGCLNFRLYRKHIVFLRSSQGWFGQGILMGRGRENEREEGNYLFFYELPIYVTKMGTSIYVWSEQYLYVYVPG